MLQLRAQARKTPTNISTEKLMPLQVVGPPRGMSLPPPSRMKKHGPLSCYPAPPLEVRIMAQADDKGGGGVTAKLALKVRFFAYFSKHRFCSMC